MMRDSESFQVENRNSATMALKALSSVNGSELISLPSENIDDEEMAEENFHLHLSEDEDDDKTEKQNGQSDEMIENEVLNKFDITDDVSIENIDAKTEDELLNDDHTAKSAAVVVGSESEKLVTDNVGEGEKRDKSSEKEKDTTETVDKEIEPVEEEEKESQLKVEVVAQEEEKVTEEAEKVAEVEKMVLADDEKIKENAEIKQEEVDLDDLEQVDKDAEVVSETNKKDKSAAADDCSVNIDVLKKEIKKEVIKEGEETEQTNAEILKNQIMDTEDLLQIVENDTEENDKESNDKVESEDNEAETDKNEEEEEQDEDSQGDKKTSDDGVDIEESSLSKDATDVDMDREYQSIVDDAITKENEENEKKTDTEVVEEAPSEAPADATEALMDVEEDENKENNEEAVKKEATPEKDEETSEPPKKDDNDSTKTITSVKRTLVEEENIQQDAKKMKLSTTEDDDALAKELPVVTETPAETDEEQQLVETKQIVLGTVGTYLKKNCLKNLCYEDLEEICMQKVCEAICYKSEIGELRHQLGVQEQMAEMWRKEVAQLSKQARDLEIVNKRLLHEVRLKNEREKPLVPVKITRSVGLQVRSDMLPNVMASKQRRLNRSPQTATPAFNQKQQVRSPLLNNSNNRINKVSVPNRPQQNMARVAPVQNTKIKVANQKNCLLSQALQNATNAANATGPSTTPAVSQTVAAPTTVSVPATSTVTPPKATLPINRVAVKKPAMTTKTVIDLTDEDTTTTTPARSTPVAAKNAMVSKAVTTTAGVRILTSSIKPGVLASGQVVPTTNASRFMYLYNNNQLLTADGKPTNQKVMFKIGAAGNGVLASVANGSTIVNTSTRTGQQVSQLKLTSQQGTASVTTTNAITRAPASKVHISKHPAPLPAPPITQNSQPARKPIPPKPHLSIKRSGGGIVLSWRMPYNLDNFESIVSYQLYAYQETTSPPSSDMWRKVGDVKALALPMACTLTQFADGNKYHFAVRAVDVHKRMGPFSAPEQILL